MEKKKVVYFHRYPMEYESVQFPAMKLLLKELAKKYEVIYFSMKSRNENAVLHKELAVNEIQLPMTVEPSDRIDKLIKTFLYYLFLPVTLIKLKNLNPDFIIIKETLPFIPLLVGNLKIPMFIDTSDWWWSILLGKAKRLRKFAQFMEDFEVRKWSNLDIVAVAHSEAEAKLVNEKGMDKNKIAVVNAPQFKEVYFPVNASDIRRKLNLTKDNWVITMHGVIHPSKGYEQIIDWWSKIEKIHQNWKLMIIGGAGSENSLKKKIQALNLKNVIMTGWLKTQEEVNKYLNASDCLLVTRRNTPENQGVMPSSLYHSLPLAKPTLATGLPGMAEIIKDKKTGYLFTPDDYNSFKSVLEHIYSHPREAKKVANQGKKYAEKCFNPKTAVEKYIQIIDRLLN